MRAADAPSRFPFAAAMGFAFAHLRLSPDAFWAMAPGEFLAAFDAARGASAPLEAPARDTLDALMARYPDQP